MSRISNHKFIDKDKLLCTQNYALTFGRQAELNINYDKRIWNNVREHKYLNGGILLFAKSGGDVDRYVWAHETTPPADAGELRWSGVNSPST